MSALAAALREALGGEIRTFNTSSGTAIPPGSTWRKEILAAIRDSMLVVLWATPTALGSREVAFEIGAAFAYDKDVLSCCVNIAPSSLPWSLSERQALSMDQELSWSRLADQVANTINFSRGVDYKPLRDLARRFQVTSESLQFLALGQTLEIQNTSASLIRNLHFIRADPNDVAPAWSTSFEKREISPGESIYVLRDEDEGACRFHVSWDDMSDVTHQRLVEVPPVGADAE